MAKLLFVCFVLLMTIPVLAACGGNEEPTPAQAITQGDPEEGRQLFAANCAACHGPNGEGLPGLGTDLRQNEFVAGLSDEALMVFIQEGRSVDDPQNTTDVEMPPYGGNPALTDEQLLDIIAFMRSLQ